MTALGHEVRGWLRCLLFETVAMLFCKLARVTYKKSESFQPRQYMMPKAETIKTPPYDKTALLLQHTHILIPNTLDLYPRHVFK